MGVPRFLYSQLLVKPPAQIQDFTDQVIVITGGNTGLGFAAARQLLSLNAAKIIITARSDVKGEQAIKDLASDRVSYQFLDMGSYASVLRFAEFLGTLPRLDALVLNAGCATTEFSMLEDNESTITVNVVSTMLLAVWAVPVLGRLAGELGRVVVVSSDTHEFSTLATERKETSILDALNDPKTARMDERYFTSKLLEILSVRSLAPSLPSNVSICTVNPGLCHSSLTNNVGGWEQKKYAIMKALLARSTEDGARAYVHALGLGREANGAYVSDYRVNDAQLSSFVKSKEGAETQRRIWDELVKKLKRAKPGVMDAILVEDIEAKL